MNVAFIPVRGGSKSIPLKNIQPMCGRPLVYWTVRAACLCDSIDRVYVATDSSEIREAVEAFCAELGGPFAKTQVIGRSAESATDTASTEFAMLEFADSHEFDVMVLVQATSPLLDACDLARGFEEFARPDTDSVLSVVAQKRFIWEINETGEALPTNYDVYARPRRQEFDGYLVENGAFYITTRDALLESQNRVSGRIHAVEMPEETFFEIDEPSDWIIIESLLARRLREASRADGSNASRRIRLFLTDCDGCLTDGGMYYSEAGDELKRFDTRDGLGLRLLREAGIKVGVVTSEDRALNRRRAEKLKLDYLIQGCTDKLSAVLDVCGELGIDLADVAYMGDDLNDLPVLKAVAEAGGLATCPADARSAVQDACEYVCHAGGGHSAVREVADHILAEVQ